MNIYNWIVASFSIFICENDTRNNFHATNIIVAMLVKWMRGLKIFLEVTRIAINNQISIM